MKEIVCSNLSRLLQSSDRRLMSSTTSLTANSTDVVLLPHPLNHLDPNHDESNSTSTSKPLKRARSPSLLPDDLPDETLDHQTPTKKSRRKRNTTDIDHSLGAHLSAEKLHIYRWPLDDAQADFHVLQEQICDYLSLKSFKRKYPGKRSTSRGEFQRPVLQIFIDAASIFTNANI